MIIALCIGFALGGLPGALIAFLLVIIADL